MPKNSLNVSLKGADDIFSTEESRQEQQREQVQQIPIGELFPFKNHPFKVLDDESMQRTVESVEQYGVLSPLIARPRPEGGYEIISGHRRQHAAQLAGLDTLPVIVRQMDDDAAVLLMVDSNLQRENILPSERAFAYKMKLEAIERTVGRPKNVGQVVPDYKRQTHPLPSIGHHAIWRMNMIQLKNRPFAGKAPTTTQQAEFSIGWRFCPVCGNKLYQKIEGCSGILQVKCNRCKETLRLDLAFRCR